MHEIITEYPEHCKLYYGPNNVDCLVTIWGLVKCLPQGTKHPHKMNSTESNYYGQLNIRLINNALML